jgi:ferredoxin
MVERNDDSGFKKLAVINTAQCTACAICVGACPTDAIHLQGGYNSEQTFNAVKGALHRELKEGHAVTVLFAGQRDQAMGGLPARLRENVREGEPVFTSAWDADVRVVTAVLPSIAAVNIEWIRSLHTEGARDTVLLSHPYDDGLYREDPHWMLNRLHLHSALVTKDLHWLETSPGDAGAVEKFLNNLHRMDTQNQKQPKALPPVKDRNKLIPSLVSGLVGTLLLLGAFALALPLDVESGMHSAEQSALRLAVDAKGKIEAANIPEGVTLPEGADPVKIFGGVHFPISVRVLMDGETILEETYKPSGISGNGRISALEFLNVAPGTHHVEVWMKDDSDEYRLVFSGEVIFEQGRALILAYDEKTDTFVLR